MKRLFAGLALSAVMLGLAIAHGFVEANGGRLWAESHPGQGTTLALALPLARVPVAV